MDLLEYYHNQHPKNETYTLRKVSLPTKQNINLYGVRGAGKTAMILDYLQDKPHETTLYIDLENPNLYFTPLTPALLQTYIDTHNITLLILDHYTPLQFDKLPQVAQTILLSRLPLQQPTFTPIELFPLDYEEFLAFENTFATSTTTFNRFLRKGTLPSVASLQKSHTLAIKQFLQSHFDLQEQKLLLILAQHHTKHLTIYQIYTFAKAQFKISKDWLYKKLKVWQEEKLILFIEDASQKSGKKMLLFDFAFAKYLTTGQPFITQFDTMIALALLKHHIPFKTLGIHGYLLENKQLIIPAPFESEESLWVKSQNKFSLYKRYHIQDITIVTVANSYTYTIEKLQFEALPFYEWSILHNEKEFTPPEKHH